MELFFIENKEIIIKLFLAVVLGTCVGTERLFMHKEAGMKTHSLVALGAALFVIISEMIAVKYGDLANFDPSRIASQIIVGIGFIGAGMIMFRDSRLSGLSTASGVWVTAGIGMAVGFGFFSLALVSTILVLLIFIFMNVIERPIRKITEDLDGNQN